MEELSKIVQLYDSEPKLVVSPTIHKFKGAAPRGNITNPNWEGAAQFYNLKHTGWKELVYNVVDIEQIKSGAPEIDVNVLMSYDIQAERENVFGDNKSFQQMVVIGAMITKDNFTITGKRAPRPGSEPNPNAGHGLLGAAPSGHVEYQTESSDNPIIDTAKKEFAEEIGPYDVTPILLGVSDVKGPGPKGYRFVVAYLVDENADTIIKNHEIANKIHQSAYKHIKGNDSSLDADLGEQFKELGLPPHAWEHSDLTKVPLYDNSLEKVLARKETLNGIADASLGMLYSAVKENIIPLN